MVKKIKVNEEKVLNSPTSKSVFLSTGVTLISTGTIVISTERIWEGIVIVALGIGCLIAREVFKTY